MSEKKTFAQQTQSWETNAWFTQAAASFPRLSARSESFADMCPQPSRHFSRSGVLVPAQESPNLSLHEAQARRKARDQATRFARVENAVGFVLTRLRTALALYSHPWAMLLPLPFLFRLREDLRTGGAAITCRGITIEHTSFNLLC